MPLLHINTQSPFQLPCPACGQNDLWLHVTGLKTFAHRHKDTPDQAFNHRFEKLVCHGCGVTAPGRHWNQLSPKRAKTQFRHGYLAGALTLSLPSLLMLTIGWCLANPPPHPALPTPPPIASHAPTTAHR